MTKLKLVVISLLVICLIALLGGIFVYQKAHQQLEFALAENMQLKVDSGDTVTTIVASLPVASEDDFNLLLFKIWLKLNPEKASVKKGYYQFDQGLSIYQLLDKLNKGDTEKFYITLVEGLTLKQWYQQISNVSSLKNDLPALENLYQSLELQAFCENPHLSLEGCLLPDTYQYSYQDSATSIVQRAHQSMAVFLEDAWQQRFPDIPITTVYEGLILASIIEKETAVASERGVIAGVFTNRLESNMRLQTDPTVIYGIGDAFDGNITRKHLRTTTPYNTYRIKGLPITPIAMPSRASIVAALNPEITDYIYFVSKGDGTHQFSETLAEHEQAVRQYQLNKGN
ncbi:endolytic transglycosylase MltG [Glaciecola sp. 1036]|uniref:endolytic transglycosylase MltG n=1 Tax=Alteromonadaceae TaxID=72275 RepID=UPI003D003F58